MTPKFFATIQNGKPVFDSRGKLMAYLSGYKDGTRIEATFKQYRRQRTNPQNKYYWGVVVPILANHFGYTKDEMHDALRWQFLRKQDKEPPTVRSTAELTTVEFNAYIDEIVIWAATEFQVVVPDPGEIE